MATAPSQIAATDDAASRPRSTQVQLAASLLVLFAGVAVVVWVIVRNEPFKDAVSPQIIRVVLGLMAGWGIYSLPGQLGFSFAASSQKVTATSAFGVFALVYLGTPTIVPPLDPQNVSQPPPAIIPTAAWSSDEYLRESQASASAPRGRTAWLVSYLTIRDQPVLQLRGLTMVVESAPFPVPYDSFNGQVWTVPAERLSTGHTAIAFLVTGEPHLKTFIPLTSFYSTTLSENRAVIQVPASKKDDYLLIILQLATEKDEMGKRKQYTTGKSFPFQLRVLQ